MQGVYGVACFLGLFEGGTEILNGSTEGGVSYYPSYGLHAYALGGFTEL